MHKIGHGGTHLTSWAQELHQVSLDAWRVKTRSDCQCPRLWVRGLDFCVRFSWPISFVSGFDP